MPVSIEDFVSKAQQNQIPEDSIRQVLIEKGHKEEEINAVLRPNAADPNLDLANALNPVGSKSQVPPPNAAGGQGSPGYSTEQHMKGSQKTLAIGAEYGLPAAVTLMMPEAVLLAFGTKAAPYVGAGISALATGAGTIAGRMIEGKDPVQQQFRDAGVAMAADLVMNLGLSWGGRIIAGKMFKKGEVAKDVTGFHTMAQDAQDILGETNRYTGKTWYGAPKSSGWVQGDPGSLTLGGMEGKSSELAKTIEGFLRGSFIGKGKFKQADELNINAVEEIYSNFVNQVSDATNDVRFGKVLQSLTVGTPDPVTGKIVKGGITGWIDDTKTALYDSAKRTYEGKGLTVDISHVRQQMDKFKGVPEFDEAFSLIKQYIPEDRVIPGKEAYTIKTGEMDRWGSEVTEMIPKEADKIEQVNNIPVEQAILLKRDLNRAIKSLPDKYKGDINATSGQVDRLRDKIYASLEGADDKGVAFKLAEAFVGTSAQIHEQALAKNIVKKLSTNPTTVLGYMESAKNTTESLDQLERLWKFASEGMQGKVDRMNLPSFEDAVIRPLRYDILNEAYNPANGAFNPKGIQAAIEKYDETTRIRLFGQDYNDRLTKISNAAVYLSDYKHQDRILASLVESGLVGSAAFSAVTGSSLTDKALKTLAVISLFSTGMSNMMTRPKFANRIIEGLNFGPTDSRFLASMYALTSEALTDMNRMREKSPNAAKFYTIQGVQDRMTQKQANSASPIVAPEMTEMMGGMGGMAGM